MGIKGPKNKSKRRRLRKAKHKPDKLQRRKNRIKKAKAEVAKAIRGLEKTKQRNA